MSGVQTFTLDAATNDSTSGNDSITVAPSAGAGMSSLRLLTGTGDNSVSVQSDWLLLDASFQTPGSLDVIVTAGVSAYFAASQTWSTLTMNDYSSALIQPGAADSRLRLGELFLADTATLDLFTNALIVEPVAGSPDDVLAALSSAVARARNAEPLWSGAGITSSVASWTPWMGLAAVRNLGADGLPIWPDLGGEPLSTNCVIVALTLNGDADLDGDIDADDYFHIDQGFINGGSTCRAGDLDYSGSVDADDYYLIDAAFMSQFGGSEKAAMRAAPMQTIPVAAGNSARYSTGVFSTAAQMPAAMSPDTRRESLWSTRRIFDDETETVPDLREDETAVV